MTWKWLAYGCLLSAMVLTITSSPAEARLQPRLDLPEGWNIGLQANNLSLDYRLGPTTMGLNMGSTRDGATPYLDPSLRLGLAFFDNGHLLLGWLATAESNLIPETRDYAPGGNIAITVPAKPHQWMWATGPVMSVYHDVRLGEDLRLRLHFDPALMLTLKSDGSVDTGTGWGYDMGIQFNQAFDLLIQNTPILQTTVIGVRAHL